MARFSRNRYWPFGNISFDQAAVLLLTGSLVLFGVLAAPLSAAVVEYDLHIAQQDVNITGQTVKALTLNGGLPGPTLRFTEGDHAVIHVHNQLAEETSIHWHGILLPNAMDGVPFVTFPPILPGSTFTYEFDLRHSGTYWYHSHTMLQEQRGMFGAFIIEPRVKGLFDGLRDHTVLLSDWTDEDPDSVLHTLKRGSEWYSLRKGSGQSLLGAARVGLLGAYLSREIQRMPPMDIADVFYDRFLLNGQPEQTLAAEPGEQIRLRIIDGSATTFFYLQFAGGPLKIIGADGMAVQPIDEERLLIGVAETYDLLVTVPGQGFYELRATAHDGSGHASLWIGSGRRHAAPDIPFPNVYKGMGGLSLRTVFALTPAGAMGMPEKQVRRGMFDQPGMHGMMGMEHGDMAADGGAMDHGAMASGQATETAAHDMHRMEGMGHDGSGAAAGAMDHGAMAAGDTAAPEHGMGDMVHGKMQMASDALEDHDGHGTADRHEPAVTKGTWFGLLAEDAGSKAPLATDGMDAERPWPPYDRLRSLQSTAFDPAQPVREIRLTLEEDMERYVWFLNNAPLSAADDIEIKQGEVVRFIMINRTMMHHPMHLHGHFFRVINGQGDHAPLKHTVDVAPMATTVIEFDANEFGDWFFHCHLLYHMESGMARLVHYQGFQPTPATAAVRARLYHDPFYFFGQVDLMSHMVQGELTYANTRHIFSAEWHGGWRQVDELEWGVTPTYDYYLNRFFRVFGGVDLEGVERHLDRHEGVFGVRYLLPFNVESRVWLDTAGEVQFAAAKHLTITPRLTVFGEAVYDTEEKWRGNAGMTYLLSKHVALVGQWHSEFRWGVGLRWLF
jgi:hypothetical protein